MALEIGGIHHITAMAGDPQGTIDVYTGILGLRLVKRTVNFDDPRTYHFYLADREGSPGTILTFFPWGARAGRGRAGTGQVSATAFSIPPGSTGFWAERLRSHGLHVDEPRRRFADRVLALNDPDGLALELVECPDDRRTGWETPEISSAHAIRGLHGATLSLEDPARTATLLTETMGFRPVAEEGGRFRLEVGSGGPGASVDLLCEPGGARGTMSVGTVHHIAWRTRDDASQGAARAALTAAGQDVTPVLDRRYFRSIYFREPGRVLFELATDPPGFLTDERATDLGTRLMLPPWLEPSRAEIERHISPVVLPRHNNP